MGKKEKEHRKKVAKRNEMIKENQKKIKKAQDEFLKKLIEHEKAAGKFNNEIGDLPKIDLGEGPKI